MTFAAVAMMIVAMLIIWGGFVLAARFLVRHPMKYGGDEEGYVGPVAPKDT